MLGAGSAGPQSGGEPGARPDLLALDVLAGARRVKDDDLAVDLPGVDPDVVDVATIVEEDQVAGAHPALADLAGVLRLLVGRARHVEAGLLERVLPQSRAVEGADRKSVVEGQRVAGRVSPGGWRIN